MINYVEKKETINLSGQEWKNIQNQILLSAIAKQQKIDQNAILREAVNVVTEKELDKMRENIEKEFKNIFNVVSPNVEVKEINTEKFEAEINFAFYEHEELKKINYKNNHFPFEYRKVDNNFLNNSFQKFINQYPLLTDVKEPISKGDLVKLNYQIKNNKEQDKQPIKDLIIEAKVMPSFSINENILGRKVGEKFELNDPENNHWTIEIIEVKRKVPTLITNENIDQLNIKDVTNLEQLKTKLFQDFIKDHASNELLRYYKLAIFEIGKNNTINFSNSNLEYEMMQVIRENPRLLKDELLDKTLSQIKEMSDPEVKNLMMRVENSAKYKMFTLLLEYLVTKDHNLLISEQEAKNEIEYFNTVNLTGANLNLQQVAQILHTQKIALYIAKYNNPEFYEEIKNDIRLSVN
ncbi:hypothetical protein MCSF7_01541 [Mycoplasmopsis columbina SF7]|uniref:Trigger factor n=1 Tax=Mycoplasmopsis columbina SF7 TaxID=1037410 RepID=F9UK97_9BACT|nr:hypothetical protein [Mycoplasmopsis columbina]EGV00102.1 hypothetical protein MCSF7_01541 [Mycoplasmopsis columbina SF7]